MLPDLENPAEQKLAIADIPSVWSIEAKSEWLIDGAITAGTINILTAESGTGKSWVAYDIAGSVALGRDFAGRAVRQRPVIYLDGENPVQVVQERLKLLGIGPNDNLKVWGGWIEDPPPGPDDPRIIEFAKEYKPLMIWDSLVEFHLGDEMSATETRAFMRKFRALANLGATPLILHHAGKAATAQDYRGSSDIKAVVDTAYKLETVEERDGGLYRLRMATFKARGTLPMKLNLEFHPGQGFSEFAGQLAEAKLKPADIIQTILEEHGELNGIQIKEKAKGKYGAARQPIDDALRTWPNQRKGEGRSRLYSPTEMLRAA